MASSNRVKKLNSQPKDIWDKSLPGTEGNKNETLVGRMCQAYLKHSKKVHVFGTKEVRESVVGDGCSRNNVGSDHAELMDNYQTFAFNSERGSYR